MRLAAMTASEEEVEELSKTLRMARPSVEQLKRSEGGARKVVSRPRPAESGAGGYILLAIIALVVVGLISTILF
ncbi:MAG: hypothetical protein Fur0040_07160 [Sideroxydans sp.]